MNAKLISITSSIIDGVSLTAEELIVFTARASNPSNQLNTETSDKLLRYLIKNKHWSPFDMVDLCVEVKTSRAIAAQILRHWSFDFQEFSQRYAEVVDLEPIELREQGSTTRQGSKQVEFNPPILFNGVTAYANDLVKAHMEYSVTLYKQLLAAGVAKEVARMVLPLTTQTTLYMKASVRSWMFYFSQRLDAHAQKEHRELAELIYPLFKANFPNVTKAFFDDAN